MILLYFFAAAVLHLVALSIPLFFDVFVLPGYLALFMFVSLLTAIPAAWIKGLRPWQIGLFLPFLFLLEQGYLVGIHLLDSEGGFLRNRAMVSPEEFVNAIAQTGIIVSITSWFLTGLVLIVSLVVKRQRDVLFVHRLVDTEDEWNRIYLWMRARGAAEGISSFHWRLLRQRTFAFVAEKADILHASLLLIPGNPGEAYLSDFAMDSAETGAELLGAVLNRPELRNCTQIYLIERHSPEDEMGQARQNMAAFLFRQLIPEERWIQDPGPDMHFLKEFSPDGSRLRPLADAFLLAAARGEGQPHGHG